MPALDVALKAAFTPLAHDNSTFANGDASGTPALLTADIAATQKTRRITITNLHASQVLTVCLVQAGVAIDALTTTSGYRIPAGAERVFLVSARSRVALVASGASTGYSAIISDV